MDYKISVIKKKQIEAIKKLWEKLNQVHLHDSNYFKEFYQKFTFEERCKKFIDVEEKHIRIEIVEDKNIPIGYCISTIENNTGEIDSIFIEEECRKFGFGEKLLENGINWLKENNCDKIVVAVADGHESVFGYYKKFGFYPRMTYLQMKE